MFPETEKISHSLSCVSLSFFLFATQLSYMRVCDVVTLMLVGCLIGWLVVFLGKELQEITRVVVSR